MFVKACCNTIEYSSFGEKVYFICTKAIFNFQVYTVLFFQSAPILHSNVMYTIQFTYLVLNQDKIKNTIITHVVYTTFINQTSVLSLMTHYIKNKK